MRSGNARLKTGSLEFFVDRNTAVLIHYHKLKGSGRFGADIIEVDRKDKPTFLTRSVDLETARIIAKQFGRFHLLTEEKTMANVTALHEYEDFLVLRIEWEERDSKEYFTEYYVISSDDTAKNMAMLFRHVDGNIVYKLGRKKGVQCKSIEEGDKIVDDYLQGIVVDAALNGGRISA